MTKARAQDELDVQTNTWLVDVAHARLASWSLGSLDVPMRGLRRPVQMRGQRPALPGLDLSISYIVG
jgi:hypothetical protein